jgi:uncharacterized damage-inducible protein DinB
MFSDAKPLPGYDDPYGLLCAILKDGTNEWRWELDPKLSEDAIVWQPYPGTHSIGALVMHIVHVEIYWFETFVLGLPRNDEEMKLTMADTIDQDAWTWPEPPKQPIKWYFDLHDRVRARTLKGIRDWPSGDSTITRGSRQATPRWVLGHVIQHEAYHGGQAVLLNRLWQLRSTDG